MKKCSIFLAVIFFVLFTWNSAFCFILYRIGAVPGYNYNKLFNKWLTRNLIIFVGIDGRGKEIIAFETDGYMEPTVYIENKNDFVIKKLKQVISKFTKWAEIAIENQVNIDKSIGCLGDNGLGPYWKKRRAKNKNEIGFLFFSASKGKDINLVVNIIDFDSKFKDDEIYIEFPEIKKFKEIVEKIKPKLDEARKQAKKKALFK